jgi:hypothetical protein
MFSLLRGERIALSYALILYAFTLFVLFTLKPSYAYKEDGNMKVWGIGDNKTMFPIYIVAMIISIIGLFVLNIIYS